LQVTANYTIQILPSVLQDVFYELCGLTLRTIFDLRIPGTIYCSSPVHFLIQGQLRRSDIFSQFRVTLSRPRESDVPR
jgi:hypothetical protein